MPDHPTAADLVVATWVVGATPEELDDGDMKKLETLPPIALHRVGDEYFATADTCTHMDFSLSDGYLDDDRVECGLHMAQFCVRTGKALSLPATQPLPTYPVRLEGETVLVGVPDDVLVPDALRD